MTLPQSKPRTSHGVQRACPTLAGLALLLLAAGCSIGTTRPPRDASGKPIDGARPCTRSVWLPALDVVGAIAGGIVLGLGLSDGSSVPTALGAGTTGAFVTSAAYGFSSYQACEIPAPTQTAQR